MAAATQVVEDRRHKFVHEYLRTLNASKAARAAGHTGTDASVAVAGSRILRDDNVRREIALGKKAQFFDLGISAQDVLNGLAHIAFADIREMFDESGRMLAIRELPAEVAACIQSIETKRYLEGRGDDAVEVEVTKVKFYDRQKALRMLGEHLKLFASEANINVNIFAEIQERLAEAADRAEKAKTIEGKLLK